MSSTFLKLPTGLKIYLDELHNGIFSHCRTLSFDGTEMKFLPGSLISQVAQQALIERVLTIDPPGPNLSRDIKTAIINRLLTNAKVVFVIAMYSKMPSKSLCHLIYDGSLALAPSACHKSTMACSSNTSKSSWPPASTKDNSISLGEGTQAQVFQVSVRPDHHNFQLRALAQALETVHARVLGHSVFHHDIKPENILFRNISSGGSHTVDFNLTDWDSSGSGQFNAAGSLGSQSDRPGGDPTYQPPEARGIDRQTTRKHDVCSLGCLFHEILIWYTEGFAALETFQEVREAQHMFDFCQPNDPDTLNTTYPVPLASL
ncbi:hypothetical protein IQ06DRAFT_309496 [Phaeosphaeriaceae sp. SRC1lsM3a]|nr:hypothetical protein IQ06DRAFT_309496 [Stagonospora sp. SRC1lsM3a]